MSRYCSPKPGFLVAHCKESRRRGSLWCLCVAHLGLGPLKSSMGDKDFGK